MSNALPPLSPSLVLVDPGTGRATPEFVRLWQILDERIGGRVARSNTELGESVDEAMGAAAAPATSLDAVEALRVCEELRIESASARYEAQAYRSALDELTALIAGLPATSSLRERVEVLEDRLG